jgi:NAD+ kinase
MKIVLHGINLQKENFPLIEKLLDTIHNRDIEFFFTETFSNSLRSIGADFQGKELSASSGGMKEMDFVLSIGGDGTLLDTVIQVGELEKPIVGINTGRLGFLATVAKEKVDQAISNLIQGEFTLESRALVSLKASKPVFKGMNFGLNEFTIHKRDTSSMIIVHTYIDGQYLNSYWADGLIVATPTGSTGYSLSCGGPLITPGARNFVITPVSPHNLNVRPIVVPDESIISFKIEGRSEKFLISLDSRSTAIDADVELKLEKAKFSAKLVKFLGYNYFDTLRQKLNWGFDMRN